MYDDCIMENQQKKGKPAIWCQGCSTEIDLSENGNNAVSEMKIKIQAISFFFHIFFAISF